MYPVRGGAPLSTYRSIARGQREPARGRLLALPFFVERINTMTMRKTEKHLSVLEFGQRFGVSKQTVYRAIDRGDIPVIRIGSTIRRIPFEYVNRIESEASAMAA